MNDMKTKALLLVLSGAAVGLGCSDGGSVNIGETQTAGAQLSDYAATWDGYVEAFQFWPDGSDRIRLTIDASGNGWLQIGDAALIAPATDPNVGYPPGAYSVTADVTSGTGTPTELSQGVLYPIHAATVETNRIKLGIDPKDIYADWCPLQTPYPGPGNEIYTCLPLNGAMSTPGQGCTVLEPDGTTQPVDCAKLELCFPETACTCTATACVASTVPAGSTVGQYPVELDGALDATGTTMTGTLTVGRVTVHLTKQ
jgi:hypothetical protein